MERLYEWKLRDWLALVWVAGLILLAFLAIYPGLAQAWEWAAKNSSNIASWVQAVGSIAAILGAAHIANRQDRLARIRAKKLAVRQARSVCASLEAITESFDSSGSLWLHHATAMIALSDEQLVQARSIQAEILDLHWIAHIHGLRTLAIRLTAAYGKFRHSPEDKSHPGLGQMGHYEILKAEVKEIQKHLNASRAFIMADYPGVDEHPI